MSEILTAETERGRKALEEVMAQSYRAEIGDLPARWVRVLLDDEGQPVSFVAFDPDRAIEFPGGQVPYGFLAAGATRQGRRGQGHFGRLLEATIEELRRAGRPWVFARLPYGLGRRLGFHVFTHYSSLVLQPEEIEQTLGGGRPEDGEGMLSVEQDTRIQEDLFLVTEARADSEIEAVLALREAAWQARSCGKVRIMFEHPPAARPGSRYPIHRTRHTPLTVVAMACGARVRVSGSERDESDEGEVRFASDMTRIIDLPVLLERIVAALRLPVQCRDGSVAFDTPAGRATLVVREGQVQVLEGLADGATVVPFGADAIAQMVTGYRAARSLGYFYEVEVPPAAAEILEALFPRFWRFSRNEKWVYQH